ncbi:Exc2 family lipoprotein, partial [Pseudomonas aeruginosa]|uniref:Exc2 family lipoprotein n=1 Tax=Pseudomonas aeruginosa TaxID=287 RepID=UPI00137020B6
MRLSTAVLALSCPLATTPGCPSSNSSPDRHAYASVPHRPVFVGGTFPVTRQENYRLNLPTFTAMYARGQQDKAAGMSESDARRTAE